MINLIPPESKKRLIMEYWARVSSLWLTLLSMALFAGAGILLPAYVLITSQVSSYENAAEAASRKVATYENVSVSLQHANQQARSIVEQAREPVFSEYVTLFNSMTGIGIELSKIQISREQGEIEPISLAGTASDRQTLAAFRDRLSESPEIESVNLPISNLANDRDIQFTITVTLANKKSV